MNTEEELRNAENLFIEGNICEAIPLLQQLTNQGVGRAIYLYGICQGYGYLDDGKLHWLDELLKAKESLRKKSIEAGEILSKLSTFDMFDDNALLLQGIWNQMNALDVRAEERKQVYEAAEKLAKHGDVIAMWALGVSQMYPAEDTRWMKQAAEEGFWMAAEWMGNAYFSGAESAGIHPDYEKAAQYYEKTYEALHFYFYKSEFSEKEPSNRYAAVKRKCHSLCGNLVECFDRLGDSKTGLFWGQKLSEGRAWKTLGDIYNELENEELKSRVSNSYVKIGKELYDHVAEPQKWDMMRQVIHHLLRQGKVSEVYSWAQCQGEMYQDPFGLWVLGKMLECHVNREKNQLFLPQCLIHDTLSSNTSYETILSVYTKLYESQSCYGENKSLAGAAALRIAFNYLGKDGKQAFSWAEKAAQRHNEKGIFLLGFCYRYGIGTKPDYNRARELFQKLEDMESEWGESGRCYELLGDLYSWTDHAKSKEAYELAMMDIDMGEAERKLNCLHLTEQGQPLSAEDAIYYMEEDWPQ